MRGEALSYQPMRNSPGRQRCPSSGGKTSAFLAMREAADRARLRWELQEAAWAWDNYCEEQMPALGVSERAARLLHMGKRVEDAMDFEKDLNMHNADYNIRTR